MTTTIQRLDTSELEQRVKEISARVARDPHGGFHFETGVRWPSGSAIRRPSSTVSRRARSNRSPASVTR